MASHGCPGEINDVGRRETNDKDISLRSEHLDVAKWQQRNDKEEDVEGEGESDDKDADAAARVPYKLERHPDGTCDCKEDRETAEEKLSIA